MRCRSIATFFFGAAPQVQCALHPYPQGRLGVGRLQPSPSEQRHKYNVRSIPIRKDDEVQVNCNLLLRSYATSTMSVPSLSARTTRCRSTATFSFGATPQVQRALHPYPQGRRGAGRLQPSPSELRHKYNVRSIPIRKDNEVQVDCNLLLWSYATSTICAPSLSARTTRCRSIATFSFGATPQVQYALHP